MTQRSHWHGGAIRALLAGSLLVGLLGVGAASATAEPNDTMATADGPVTGSVSGSIDTSNDTDWFFIYAQGSTQLDISLAGLGPKENCGEWELWLWDADGGYLEATTTGFNEISHIRYTVGSPGTYYLEVSGGCDAVGYYRLDIAASPPLLTSPPYIPPPPSPSITTPSADPPSRGAAPRRIRCRQAQRRVRTIRHKLQRTNLRRARRARARRRLRRQRARLRASLRRAQVQVRRQC